MDSVSSDSKWEFDRQLYEAATNGDIESFKKDDQHLDLILTSTKNTILHVHIIFPGQTPKSTFVAQILERCPHLLLQVNNNGDTPLHVAARYGYSAIVEALIEHAKTRPEDLESGLKYKELMMRKSNNRGNSALHEAVRNHHIGVLKILTKEDPKFSHYANDLGETPLFIAAEIGSLSLLTEILDTCKSAAHEGPYGSTALHMTVKSNREVSTRLLLMRKKNLTKETDQYGWTPLHYAAYYGSFAIAKLLLVDDISAVCMADKDRKMTPLLLAASQGYECIMREIISRCPESCEMVDNRGWNVLHFAMTKLTIKQLNAALLGYSTLNFRNLFGNLIVEKDVNGNTPLHVLAACRPWAYRRIKEKLASHERYHAVNKQHNSFHDIICYRSPQIQQEILELSNSDGTGPYSRGIIRKDEKWTIDRVSGWEKAKDSNLVVATLIATVTFTAAFTMPGGYKSEKEDSNRGTAILIKKAAFQVFVITDAIAMVLSLLAVFLHFNGPFRSSLRFERRSRQLITLAIYAMVVAFSTGTYAVLSPSLGLAIITCFIGLSFFLLWYALVINNRYSYRILKQNRR